MYCFIHGPNMAPRRINALTELQEFNSLYFCNINVETNFKISQLKFSSRKCNLMHNFVLSKQSFTKNSDYWKSKFVHGKWYYFVCLTGRRLRVGGVGRSKIYYLYFYSLKSGTLGPPPPTTTPSRLTRT